MGFKKLKRLIIIAVITHGMAITAYSETEISPLSIVPVSVNNLVIAGNTVPYESLRLAVGSPQHKGQLMIGLMQYLYILNMHSPQILLNFTTILFYSLLQDASKLTATDFRNIYNLFADQQNSSNNIFSILESKYQLKTNSPLVNINKLTVIDLITNVARGKFNAISPFILYIIVRDTDWSNFEHIFSKKCNRNNKNCLVLQYYQKSLAAITDGSNVYLNCAPDNSRLRNQHNFSLYNGNVEWIKSTQINNHISFPGPIGLSGLNNDALDGEFGSLWARVCKLGEA